MKIAQKLVINYYRAKLNMLSVISKKRAASSAFDLFCTPLRRSRVKQPGVFKEAERLQFTISGKMVRGFRWNEGARNKALIIHGFESTIKNFDRYIAALIRKDYEVLAFDAPAHGDSSGKRINLPLYVATIEKIHQLYGPFNSYIAHSLGALALTHFLERSEHDATVRAVLIAPVTEIMTSMNSFFSFLQLGEDVRKEFDRLIYERSGYWPAHYSARRAIANIHANVLWFHDEDDQLTPLEDATKVKDENHDHVQFVVTKGLGHRRIYRDNNIFKQAIDFL
jgi:pimeloyl-ACP methyl ester carboxylesterase